MVRPRRFRAVLRAGSGAQGEGRGLPQPAAGGILKIRRRAAAELAAVVGALVLLFGASLLLTSLFVRKPVPAPDVPAAVEKALRPLLLAGVREGEAVVEDPRVNEAFRLMAVRLRGALAAAEGTPALSGNWSQEIQVVVLDSPTVNALSLPGGLIVVYSGLMKRLESAEEMDAVLAHEMGHAAHRDSLTMLARQLGMATLATVLTGGGGESTAQAILRAAVNLRYSREAEDAADAFALELLPAAGIDPIAFAGALRHIQASSDKLGPRALRYLDAHEDVETRIRRAEDASRALRDGPSSGHARFAERPLGTDWKSITARLPSALQPQP